MSKQTSNAVVGGAGSTQGSGGAINKGNMFSAWANGDSEYADWRSRGNNAIATKDAKQIYFLTAGDLAALPCRRWGGGIGCGPPIKCYRHDDLVEASLAKLGRDGVVKKLEARHKREMNKRRKEEQAELARKRMKTISDNAANTAASATSAVGSTTAAKKTSSAIMGGESKEIKMLRSSLLRMAKKDMGFERSGAPKSWRFEVPGISKATFTTLMDRPCDVDLATFVKNGAYYTIQNYDARTLFGLKVEGYHHQMTKNFKREGVSQKIGSRVVVRYKPSTMELSVSGYAEISGALYY